MRENDKAIVLDSLRLLPEVTTDWARTAGTLILLARTQVSAGYRRRTQVWSLAHTGLRWATYKIQRHGLGHAGERLRRTAGEKITDLRCAARRPSYATKKAGARTSSATGTIVGVWASRCTVVLKKFRQ